MLRRGCRSVRATLAPCAAMVPKSTSGVHEAIRQPGEGGALRIAAVDQVVAVVVDAVVADLRAHVRLAREAPHAVGVGAVDRPSSSSSRLLLQISCPGRRSPGRRSSRDRGSRTSRCSCRLCRCCRPRRGRAAAGAAPAGGPAAAAPLARAAGPPVAAAAGSPAVAAHARRWCQRSHRGRRFRRRHRARCRLRPKIRCRRCRRTSRPRPVHRRASTRVSQPRSGGAR